MEWPRSGSGKKSQERLFLRLLRHPDQDAGGSTGEKIERLEPFGSDQSAGKLKSDRKKSRRN